MEECEIVPPQQLRSEDEREEIESHRTALGGGGDLFAGIYYATKFAIDLETVRPAIFDAEPLNQLIGDYCFTRKINCLMNACGTIRGRKKYLKRFGILLI